MASVTFSTTVGGDGSTVTDDDNATTGLGNGGALIRLVPMMAQAVAVVGTAVTAATSALGGATTNSTSTTSLAIGTGSKSITLAESGKAYTIGQWVLIASTANPANSMTGQVTSFSGTSLVVNVTDTTGSGTIAAWSISVTGAPTKTITGLKLTKTAPAISSNVVTLDLATANLFAVSLTANINSFTVTNIPATGTVAEFAIELTADGTARTVTWTLQGVAAKWASGTAPTLTSTNGKKDTFVFYTHDGGTSWMAFKAGQNL